MNTNHEHLDAESAELARGLDDLARAERSAAGAGFEGRIAGTTYPHLVSARAKASGCRAPHRRLMFRPLGAADNTVTRAPRDRNKPGATPDAAPLAQSITKGIPRNERCAGKVPRRKVR